MFTNPLGRFTVGIPLAMIVIYGLFLFMQIAISRDFAAPEYKEPPNLQPITPQLDDPEAEIRKRERPQPLDAASKPPPPPKLSTRKSDIDLPTPSIGGQAPSELPRGMAQLPSLGAIRINERDAVPIRPPVVVYPDRAAQRGHEGICEVRFDVDTRGSPFNVVADCSDAVFEREAVRAVRRSEFAPKIERGQPIERTNVVYPIEFRMGE